LAPVVHVPFSLPLWQFLYRQVARHRYRWGQVNQCDDDACNVHFGKQ
jgi:predicted DCC family thiol-disulfide oxidoreductase YuxK